MTTKTTPQRKPMKRKTSPLKAADDLFSRMVRDRDGCCLRCGGTVGLQCAHIWSRSYHSIRWRLENAITLGGGPGSCGCHKYFTERPAEWAEWCEERRFCENGICFGPDREWHEPHDFNAYSYSTLRQRALNDPPEKPKDALARLRLLHSEALG